MTVRRRDLGSLTAIASGQFGCVYRTGGFRLPGDPAEMAYKEFTTNHAEQVRAATQAVGLWTSLAPADRAALGRHAAWPRELVTDARGRVCGLVLPLLTADFFCVQRDVQGMPQRAVRQMSWLIATQAQRTAAGVDVPDVGRVDRYVLLAKLTYVVSLLHRLGQVYGDLSFGNVAFALDPPRIQLLDCDAVAPVTDPARLQGHTPFWAPPECQADDRRLQDHGTDVFKLGLAAVRCLTPGTGAATSQDPARIAGQIDPEGERLINAALSTTRAARPEAKELYAYFRDEVAQRVAPPEIRVARVERTRLVRGQDAVVEYDVLHAEEIAIEAVNGQAVVVDAARPKGHWSFTPDGSGPLALVVRNRYGTVRVELGAIELFDLPEFAFDAIHLPRPPMPSLPGVPVPQWDAALPGSRPRGAVGLAPSPVAELAQILPRTVPGLPVLPAPRLDDGLLAGSHSIQRAVERTAETLSAEIRSAMSEASAVLAEERAR